MNMRSAGFTIIETVLFLAISGALAVAILAGSSIAIAQQRYRDAGTTLQTFLQRQYTNASNVVNNRTDNWTCNADATVQPQDSAGPTAGASDCVIMGKFIQIKDGGKMVVASDVIGRLRPDATDPVTNDVDAFKQYSLAWTSVSQEKKQVDWGASLVHPASEGGGSVDSSLLILRSPFSGVIRTFSPADYKPGEGSYVIPPSAIDGFSTKQTYCLNSPDFTVFQRLAVIIRPGATSPSGIELFGEESGC